MGEGVTLTQFLARCRDDVYYIVNKLRLGTHARTLEEVVDEEATLAALYQSIESLNRPEDEAYDLKSDAMEWVQELDGHLGMVPEALQEAVGFDACYAALRTKHSPTFEFLRQELIPFFCAWLRDNVLTQAPA